MRARSKGKTWANDDGDENGIDIPETTLLARRSSTASIKKTDSSDDEYEDWPFSSQTQKVENQKLTINEDEKLTATNAEKVVVSSTNIIQSQKDSILDTGRLFLRSLSYNCKSSDLEALFSMYGPVSEVTLPLTSDSHRSKGFGFVQFHHPEHAVVAFSSLSGTTFQGRRLWIGPAMEKNSTSNTTSSFKSMKKTKEKEATISGTSPSQRLSSLFLSPDAIMEAISAHLGIPKRTLLTDPDAAAKMAIAETLIVEQTKAFMLQHGIFDHEQAIQRSKKIILIKNIPYVDEEGVRDFINGIGGVVASGMVRLLVPPTRAIAIGEWATEELALAAFKALSYRRFRSAPLYVEWAPFHVISTPTESYDVSTKTQFDSIISVDASLQSKTSESARCPSEVALSTTASVFVKNLNFYTTSEGLLKAFKDPKLPFAEKVTSARVCMRNDPKRGMLSCGFGFISLASNSVALEALSFLKEEPLILDGYRLQVQLAMGDEVQMEEGKEKETRKHTKENTGATLLVKNLAFEATSSELRKVFMPFGQVKRIRLPKKATILSSFSPGRHRGFAFVEFMTRADAEAALLALRHTHLYGRHLVLQWAEDDTESIEKRLRLSLQNQATSFAMDRRNLSKLSEQVSSKDNSDDEEGIEEEEEEDY